MTALLLAQAVTALALSWDGKYLAAGFQDGFLRIYDPVSGACLCSRIDQDGPVRSLDFSPQGLLLSAGTGRLSVWRPDTLGPEKALPQEKDIGVTGAFFVDRGKQVVSVDAAHRIRLWYFDKRKLKREERFTGVDVNLEPACACAPDSGPWFFVGYQGWNAEVWNIEQWKVERTFEVYSPVKRHACVFSGDGKILAFDEDETVYLYLSGSWKLLATVEPGDTATAIAFNRPGTTLIIGTAGGMIGAWDIAKNEKLVEFDAGRGRVNALAVGEVVYAGCEQGLCILPLALEGEQEPQQPEK